MGHYDKERMTASEVDESNEQFCEEALGKTRSSILPASEQQVGGTHYKDMGIQPLEFTYLNYGYIGLKAAVHTKINKYIGRVKDDEVQELEKARHALDFLIEKARLQ